MSEVVGGMRYVVVFMVVFDVLVGVSVMSQDIMVLGVFWYIDLVSWDNIQLNVGCKLLMWVGEMFVVFVGKYMKLISGKGSVKVQVYEEYVEFQVV